MNQSNHQQVTLLVIAGLLQTLSVAGCSEEPTTAPKPSGATASISSPDTSASQVKALPQAPAQPGMSDEQIQALAEKLINSSWDLDLLEKGSPAYQALVNRRQAILTQHGKDSVRIEVRYLLEEFNDTLSSSTRSLHGSSDKILKLRNAIAAQELEALYLKRHNTVIQLSGTAFGSICRCVDRDRFFPLFAKDLKDSDPAIRVFACEALAELGKREAIPLIKQMMDNETEVYGYAGGSVSHAVAFSLAQLGNADGFDIIFNSTSGNPNFGGYIALRHFRRFSDKDFGTDLLAWRNHFQSVKPQTPSHVDLTYPFIFEDDLDARSADQAHFGPELPVSTQILHYEKRCTDKQTSYAFVYKVKDRELLKRFEYWWQLKPAKDDAQQTMSLIALDPPSWWPTKKDLQKIPVQYEWIDRDKKAYRSAWLDSEKHRLYMEYGQWAKDEVAGNGETDNRSNE